MMAYFKSNETVTEERYPEDEVAEKEYDDGFDELYEEEQLPETTEEEKTELAQSRLRLAFGAGNLIGVITGTVLILILLALIFSMVHFVITDIGRSFSLFQTNF